MMTFPAPRVRRLFQISILVLDVLPLLLRCGKRADGPVSRGKRGAPGKPEEPAARNMPPASRKRQSRRKGKERGAGKARGACCAEHASCFTQAPDCRTGPASHPLVVEVPQRV